MMVLQEEMNAIKRDHMQQIVETVIESLRKEQDFVSFEKGNKIQPMAVPSLVGR